MFGTLIAMYIVGAFISTGMFFSMKDSLNKVAIYEDDSEKYIKMLNSWREYLEAAILSWFLVGIVIGEYISIKFDK
jgi:hypothetical protein